MVIRISHQLCSQLLKHWLEMYRTKQLDQEHTGWMQLAYRPGAFGCKAVFNTVTICTLALQLVCYATSSTH